MSTQPREYVSSQDGLGLSRALKPLVIGAAAVVFLWLFVAILISGVLATLILVAGLGFLGYLAATLVLAKSAVLRNSEIDIWGGYAKLVSWNPAEGVVFLKNKIINFVDDNPSDGGGIRLIYPFLGEEVVLRLPLEIQTSPFEDHEVLTKEYIPLTIRGTMYWKIADIGKFYLSISQEIHNISDRDTHSVVRSGRRPQFETAEYWLRAMAEEKTRSLMGSIGTGLLIADQLSTDLSQTPEGGTTLTLLPGSSQEYQSVTSSLAEEIKSRFAVDVGQYGLEIHRVALQEIRLHPEIYAAAVETCKSAYLPLKAHAEAIAQKMKLQAEADVIGAEALGMKAIAGNIPALAFQEFLSPLFLDFNRKRGIGVAPAAAPAQ